MIQSPDNRRPPITPQLALRVAMLGGIALVLFGVVFFRLWYLQVLSGDQYLARANENRVRDVVVQAPRGDIVDRGGRAILVDNRVANSIVIEPPRLPPAGPPRARLYRRLGAVLGMAPGRIAALVVRQRTLLPYANVTVKADVRRPVYSYLTERQTEFPGVRVQKVYLRHYAYGELAAQLFGTVGEIQARELRWAHFRGVRQGTVVGQSGLEYAYDRYLRGRDGATRIQVDALGQPKGYLVQRAPVPGKTLKLSIDLELQRTGERALRRAFGLAHSNGNYGARAGAFVALDPRNGQVLAMGSLPSFDPNVFAKPVPAAVYARLNSEASDRPLYNRAITGGYPTGSTFKPITATAALQAGYITPYTAINDPGSVVIGAQRFQNAGNQAHGTIALRQAIQVSSDVFFYLLGAHMNTDRPRGGPLQLWARRFGLGHATGVDLPEETGGNIPSPAWRTARNREELRCEHRRHVPSCGISDLRPWSIGDNVNTAVGQGDVLATPLQMAVAYAALANGGRVVRPHIGLQVQDSSTGEVLQTIDRGPGRRIRIGAENRQAVLDGLRLAAGAPGGTSADVFRGFPRPVYGKTGTAQRFGQADQSWYVCFVPDRQRPIVLAVTVEQGGFGAQAAAPAARLMLSEWFGIKQQLVEGTSRTR